MITVCKKKKIWTRNSKNNRARGRPQKRQSGLEEDDKKWKSQTGEVWHSIVVEGVNQKPAWVKRATE